MNYSVVIHDAEEGGFWAEVPALEGCYAQGETIDETLDDMRRAIESHLAFLVDDGQQIPADTAIRLATVSAVAPPAA